MAAGFQLVHGAGLLVLAAPCEGPQPCSPYNRWDRSLLGPEHTYGAGILAYDPEGLAAMVAATSLVLVGWLAGRLLAGTGRDRLRRAATEIASAGVLLLGSAWVLDAVDAANKRLLTPAFVALASAVALVVFAAFIVVLDVVRRARVHASLGAASWPLVALGRNALVVYLLERFLLQTAATVKVGDGSIRTAVLDALPGSDTTRHLVYTATLLVVVGAVTALLRRRRWYVAL